MVAPAAVKVAVCPGQTVGEFTLTMGVGLMVMVKVLATPGQVLPGIVGVTVIVEVIGVPLALVAVKAGKLPAPLAPNPIEVFEFVHVNEAPAGVLAKVFMGTIEPAQAVMFASGTTVGLGVT